MMAPFQGPLRSSSSLDLRSAETPLGQRQQKKTTCSHLQQEGLALGNFARSDALEGGVLPGVDLHVPQPREMRDLVCGGRTDGRELTNQ